ncbi:hypothetical protein [Blastopirellula marina]|uniref:Uncharacterized protein n=1 Tax=Blastopirellula marina TaxID=124 RepID=A0A2S8GKX3_9BACT|nr:hypothetical protein [Blastopirellula marina]PQO26658.1 hypothetical protein C5Y98_30220 [Blastopirellula marina]PQO45093.1 hypothetical protein C5Y93_16300 [Blastopirellula marina]PTL40969.1 hypothetical protein C5Y97_30235 [Blastopirellula marina]
MLPEDDFAKYETLRQAGADAARTYAHGVADGLDPIARIRMIRGVYGLSLREAKEIKGQVEYGLSLDQLQAELVEPLKQAWELSEEEKED